MHSAQLATNAAPHIRKSAQMAEQMAEQIACDTTRFAKLVADHKVTAD